MSKLSQEYMKYPEYVVQVPICVFHVLYVLYSYLLLPIIHIHVLFRCHYMFDSSDLWYLPSFTQLSSPPLDYRKMYANKCKHGLVKSYFWPQENVRWMMSIFVSSSSNTPSSKLRWTLCKWLQELFSENYRKCKEKTGDATYKRAKRENRN